MKRILSVILSILLITALLTGCGAEKKEESQQAEQTELVVFAAASMTETLSEIAECYKTVAPEIRLTFNFDSSGTLKTQITEGAVCDLFISAAQKQMNQLDVTADAEKNPDGLDFILPDTRVDLLENKVTLCIPDGSEKAPRSFDALAEALRDGSVLMAMGNEDVPVGQYTQKILAYYGLDEAALASAGRISYGNNVKLVTSQIKEAAVDCGVIYATDAAAAGLTVVDTATQEMCGQVIYPAAVLKNSKNADAASSLLAYLRGAEASAIFAKAGFTPLS